MPLSWNEIKSRALTFSKTWHDASHEDSEAKPFLIDFFECFGITNKRVATFEHAVKKHGGGNGYVDLFWPGILLVEMKSRGKNLDRAYDQAMDYFPGIVERDLPRYVLVCDFARFHLYDLAEGKAEEFLLADFYKHVKLFGFIAGYQTQVIKPQDPINIKAAERMGKLHDQLKDAGYVGHSLEHYLVRLLFCLFAEDTSLFEKRLFQDYIEQRTHEDGSDLAHHIASLFHVLNTPHDQRLKNLDEELASFPYINGKLFEETLPPAGFDTQMRESLLDLCALDWSRISPAIFGSLFQSIMDNKARRNLGAHYTSEENILKLIKPLFLDALWAEFDKVKTNKRRLQSFHQKLRNLTFFDPACGCGNFLVITYRELRLLELELLRVSNSSGQQVLDIDHLITVDVDQFYGIEIEEFPAQIAQVALWLTDHQMNIKVSEEFGDYFVRIPLSHSATIINGNALQLDWAKVIEPKQCGYILGNPPFVGKSLQNAKQKTDMAVVTKDISKSGILDYVAAWYIKATRYMIPNTSIQTAFVSTNSICQGEQVEPLWGWLLEQGVKIHFAHRTFSWSNEARGKAAVHCVIVGFGLSDSAEKTIFEYEDITGEPLAIKAKNINPYLVDANNIILPSRRQPIGRVPHMIYGSKPTDGGHLLLSQEEKDALLDMEPQAKDWIKPFLNADEFLYNIPRYCLWLVDCPPEVLRKMPHVMKRVEQVKNMRLASKKAATRDKASMSTLFAEIRQPLATYLLVPAHTSENRLYIPIGYMNSDIICGNANFAIPDANLIHFGILISSMHNAWLRSVCGRLESRFRYSAGIVYNNFPWPEPSDKQHETIELAAQNVLDARSTHPSASLADLYDPLTMPPDLLKAHHNLDKAVDAAYGYKGNSTDAVRVAFLFERYQNLINTLTPAKK